MSKVVVFPLARLDNEAQRVANSLRVHLVRRDVKAAEEVFQQTIRYNRRKLEARDVPDEAIKAALRVFTEEIRACLPEFNTPHGADRDQG